MPPKGENGLPFSTFYMKKKAVNRFLTRPILDDYPAHRFFRRTP